MKSILYLFLAFFIFTSCSSEETFDETIEETIDYTTDDTTEDVPSVNYDNLVVTTIVSNIGLDGANVTLSTSKAIPTVATKTILYRENGEVNFIETNNDVLANLTSGKKHEIKSRVTINGNNYDSKLETFITKGFMVDSEVFAEVDVLNKKFHMIFARGVDSGFAQPLTAYAKVGNDSVLAQNVIYENNIISFDIDEETQVFFENDTEYIPNKSFTLGLFSGDYYQHFIPSHSNINYNGEITSRWNFFNKKPLLSSYNNTENSSCLGADNRKGLLDIRGKFWALSTSELINPGADNIPDNLTIRIKNKNNSNIEKVYTIEDFGGNSNVYFECDLENFNLMSEIVSAAYTGFHSDNYLRVRYNKNFILPGDYKITFAAEKNNVVYMSNELNVVIE